MSEGTILWWDVATNDWEEVEAPMSIEKEMQIANEFINMKGMREEFERYKEDREIIEKIK
tara:strand:+ start:40 stop:219 length:180 start_codon:yes stop_codon:yes gene_type:complete